MAHISLPDQDQIIVETFDVDTPAQSNVSWSSRTKVIGLPGAQKWSGSFRTRAMGSEVKKRPWRAFAGLCKGIVNTFDLRVAKWQRYGDNPTVRSGATNGSTLPLAGFPVSRYVLRAGQYLTVPLPSGHHRCVMLTADLLSDASGNATAALNIDLGEIPVTGATVESKDPYCRVRQTNRQIPIAPRDGVWKVDFEEAL